MKLKSFVAGIVAFAICVSTVATTALAAAPVHDDVQSVYNGDGYHVEYSMSGQNVVERSHFTFSDSSTLEMTRIVTPNGTMTLTGTLSTGEIMRSTGTVDYNLFLNLYQDQNRHDSVIVPFGSEITGSQYKHVLVGYSNQCRMTIQDIKNCKTAAQLAYKISSAFQNAPAMVASKLAEFLLNASLSTWNANCDTVILKSATYEVLFAWNNAYYTHCYHQTIEEYDHRGKLISTTMDYYQSIGG